MKFLNTIAQLTPAAGFFILALMILFNSISLKKKGITIRPAETAKSNLKKWLYLLFTAFLLLFLFEITSPFHHFSLLPKFFKNHFFDSGIIRTAGALVIFVSIFLLKTTLQSFGTSLRFGLNKNNAGKLVITGIFARSRNPFFLSLLFYFIGSALIFPNSFFLIFALSAFTGIHYSILKEEKFMRSIYGKEYLNYAEKVRRYF